MSKEEKKEGLFEFLSKGDSSYTEVKDSGVEILLKTIKERWNNRILPGDKDSDDKLTKK